MLVCLVKLRECAEEGQRAGPRDDVTSAVGLKYTTSGSSLGACSSSTDFIRYGFALVFVVVDNIDCWLVDASTSHRWKPVAADRVDVPSYVLEELMG